jgi:hypothetical protein
VPVCIIIFRAIVIQAYLWRIFRIAENFNLPEGNRGANTRSQCFCHGFFCGESAGKGWVWISKAKGVCHFAAGEDTPQKSLPVTAMGRPDTSNFNNIRADSNNFFHGLFPDEN